MGTAGGTDPCTQYCVHGECAVVYDKGEPVSAKCLCPMGYFGMDCGETVAARYALAWSLITWTLVAVYALIALVALFQFILLVCQGQNSRSYRKVTIAAVLLAAFLRTVWLMIDPFTFKDIFPNIVESLFYQVVPGLIVTAYSFILAFWVKLIRVLVPYTMKFCRVRIDIILVIANLGIWILLIPEAILLNVVSRHYSDLIMGIYTVYLSAYLLILALGFLTLGLTVYYYYVHPIGMAKMNNHMITKMTILAVVSSVILLFTIGAIVMGASFALDFTDTPMKFLVFQTTYRGAEVLFCAVVLILAGDWDTKAWTLNSFRKESAAYGALSVEFVDSGGEEDLED